ncbi:hypothetical protein MKX03_005663 [Papaver bracteatum]|nr:hypothetical protein MKX03_005663 [Papaver bracteatum]
MTWCNSCEDDDDERVGDDQTSPPSNNPIAEVAENSKEINQTNICKTCPSCGYQIQSQEKAGINDLPGLPAGVKFDPTDTELLEHLEGKVRSDVQAHQIHHPLIDEFIPTLEGENGICYTHPEKLPGVNKDGLIRHFFHRPSKAYTTGTRKRRKVHTEDEDGGETRWHKTGKTRPVFVGGKLKGYKKILVLYTNYGKKRKPEKTNWVMHQYHLGNNEEEKDGELVVSKVFFQTQPRQCNSSSAVKDSLLSHPAKSRVQNHGYDNSTTVLYKEFNNNLNVEYYNPSTRMISYGEAGTENRGGPFHHQMIPNFVLHQAGGSSFLT